MSSLAYRLKQHFFREAHPYSRFEEEVERYLLPHHTLLDAGCGRTAPVLTKFTTKARRLIGVDVVDFAPAGPGVELLNSDLGHMSVASGSVDIVMARSVMEHVKDPESVYAEIYRILKPNGCFVFLTANLWDYASIIAMLIPNRFHPIIVANTEGRREEDVFPVAYRTNTRRAVERLSKGSGFELVTFAYLGQYPSYFMFNGLLFLLATAYEKIVRRVKPLNCLQGWILVTLRKPDEARSCQTR